MKVLISGGGTGGHIFPALSIANALRRRMPDVEILFVGAEGRMEMERVPAAGYKIVGLPVSGFDRKRLWRNFGVLMRLWRSMRMAKNIARIPSRHSRGRRRICQRTDAQGSAETWHTHPHTGAEFICRSHQQTACRQGWKPYAPHILNGTFLPIRQDIAYGQPCALGHHRSRGHKP